MYEALNKPLKDLDVYEKKLGVSFDQDLSVEFLNELIFAHQCQIPFENLDIYEDKKEVSLETDALVEKILKNDRGGYCFELNNLFAKLLSALGYEVFPIVCRIVRNRDFVPPISHRANIAKVGSVYYFCDVGYGGPQPACALKIAEDAVSVDSHKNPYKMNRHKDVTSWWRISFDPNKPQNDPNWVPLIDFLALPAVEADFIPYNYYNATNSASVFTQQRMLNMRMQNGYRALTGTEYIDVQDDVKSVKQISSEQEIERVIKEDFGIKR